jgi:hypothetical protein
VIQRLLLGSPSSLSLGRMGKEVEVSVPSVANVVLTHICSFN